MNSVRCCLLMVAGFALASARPAAAAEITDYCPPDTKQVTVVDLARIRASAAAKSWQGERSFVESVKAEWFRLEPNSEAEWKKMSQREAIEAFANKTSRLMVCDTGGFLNLIIVAQGEFDPAKMRKTWEDSAATENKKLTVTVKPRYTLYTTDEHEFFIQIDEKTVAMVGGDEKLRNAFTAMLDQEKLPPAASRCATIVTKMLADREVCFASAGEDAPRSLFGNDSDFQKTYDIFERTIAARGTELDFKFRKVHESDLLAIAQIVEIETTRKELIAKNPKAKWIDALKAVSVEKAGKEVRARGKLDVGVAKSGLMEVVFFPEN